MKTNISFKMWITVLFGGIWQFICSIFSLKCYKYVGRFLGISLGVLALFICFVIVYAVYDDIERKERWADREDVSARMQFVRPYNSSKPGWISRVGSNEKLIKGVEWVDVPENADSLAVFSKKGKYGYFNRYNGHEVISPKYDAADLFNNGIATVTEGDSIRFINEKGLPIMDKAFRVDYSLNYVFHGDYCLMGNGQGAVGLIDKTGNWAVNPEYDEIIPAARNYWMMRKGDGESALWYAFTDKAEPVNMDGVRNLEINNDLGVIYTLPNHLNMVIDFEGNRQEMFLCQEVETMYYITDKYDDDGCRIQETTTLCRYMMPDNYEGLCQPNGKIVTEPLYWKIVPIGKDLYHCTFNGTGNGVIINSKGEIAEL